tara:strand:+ start:87 stop:914 length:828 start_codon:yes stop_codon:yes gene_type:complete
MKKKYTQIHDFVSGQNIIGFFVCKAFNCKISRLGDEFIDIILEDSTGVVRAKIWSNINYFKNNVDISYPLAVKGKIITYNNKLEIDISSVKSVFDNLYDIYGFNENLLYKHPIEVMQKYLNKLEKISNNLSSKDAKIINKIICNYKSKLIKIPSINNKYSTRGGYLRQLVSILDLNQKIYKKYSLEYERLVFGIILKNIGLLEYFMDDSILNIPDSKVDKGYKLLGLDLASKYISNNHAMSNYINNLIISDGSQSNDIYINYINSLYAFDSKVIN